MNGFCVFVYLELVLYNNFYHEFPGVLAFGERHSCLVSNFFHIRNFLPF